MILYPCQLKLVRDALHMKKDVAKIHCDGAAMKSFQTFINHTLHKNGFKRDTLLQLESYFNCCQSYVFCPNVFPQKMFLTVATFCCYEGFIGWWPVRPLQDTLAPFQQEVGHQSHPELWDSGGCAWRRGHRKSRGRRGGGKGWWWWWWELRLPWWCRASPGARCARFMHCSHVTSEDCTTGPWCSSFPAPARANPSNWWEHGSQTSYQNPDVPSKKFTMVLCFPFFTCFYLICCFLSLIHA